MPHLIPCKVVRQQESQMQTVKIENRNQVHKTTATRKENGGEFQHYPETFKRFKNYRKEEIQTTKCVSGFTSKRDERINKLVVFNKPFGKYRGELESCATGLQEECKYKISKFRHLQENNRRR